MNKSPTIVFSADPHRNRSRWYKEAALKFISAYHSQLRHLIEHAVVSKQHECPSQLHCHQSNSKFGGHESQTNITQRAISYAHGPNPLCVCVCICVFVRQSVLRNEYDKAKFLRTNAFQLFSFVYRSLHTLQPTTNSTMNKYVYYAIIALCCFSARYPNRTSHHATKWRSIYCNYSDSAVSQRWNVSALVCGDVPWQYNAHLGSL